MKAQAIFRIFTVEDDPWYGELLKYHLSRNPDFEIHRFQTARECLSALNSLTPHLITLDYSLPDMSGEELYARVRKRLPNTPIIFISAQQDIDKAIGLLKAGAEEYLVKDERTKDRLWEAVHRILQDRPTSGSSPTAPPVRSGKVPSARDMIIGQSTGMQQVLSLIERAAAININISILGETGTGKELVAKAIHQQSERRKHPFVAINVAAIPADLAESELFGHEKGAFTGAANRKVGCFERANNGTLFLDEIAEMDLQLQRKLLRVLQERELVRIGGTETVRLDIRLVVATHKNLLEEVRQGRFREDLYYRLLGLPIVLPPLRERLTDLPSLASFFIAEFCRENQLPIPTLTPEAVDYLSDYPFPGNIRELKAILQLAIVMGDGVQIRPEDCFLPASDTVDFYSPTEEKPLRHYTVQVIKSYLKKYNNNIVLVAEKLDIGKSTIYKMIKNKELPMN